MPVVRIDLWKGRDKEKKKELIEKRANEPK